MGNHILIMSLDCDYYNWHENKTTTPLNVLPAECITCLMVVPSPLLKATYDLQMMAKRTGPLMGNKDMARYENSD